MSTGIDLLHTDTRAELARDVVEGLASSPRRLPSKWLYDGRGSQLFEQITRTPEYYLTRTEAALLDTVADELVAQVRPAELVEIGSGSSRKTRLLLEAMHRHGSGDLYVPFDVSQDAVEAARATLTADYPWLTVRGVVGDFHEHLHEVSRSGRRLVACLGSTIGNFPPAQQVQLLTDIREILEPGDAALLGADLVKDPRVLEAAYDDDAGVTAEFTLNLLEVLRRELGAEIDADAFRHVARWQPEPPRIEIGLQAVRPTELRFHALGLVVPLEVGEEIRTEVCSKYTRESLTARLAQAGLVLRRFDTDPDDLFALALAERG